MLFTCWGSVQSVHDCNISKLYINLLNIHDPASFLTPHLQIDIGRVQLHSSDAILCPCQISPSQPLVHNSSFNLSLSLSLSPAPWIFLLSLPLQVSIPAASPVPHIYIMYMNPVQNLMQFVASRFSLHASACVCVCRLIYKAAFYQFM